MLVCIHKSLWVTYAGTPRTPCIQYCVQCDLPAHFTMLKHIMHVHHSVIPSLYNDQISHAPIFAYPLLAVDN